MFTTDSESLNRIFIFSAGPLSVTRPPAEIQPSEEEAAISTDPAGMETTAANATVNDTAFWFFDLPPELRNDIYRQLLLFAIRRSTNERPSIDALPREGSTCYPEILATCQQAYLEARTILHEENTFNVEIGSGGASWDEARLAVNGHSVASTLRSLSTNAIDWRGTLLGPSTLHLRLAMDAVGPLMTTGLSDSRSVVNRLNRALYDFIDFLRGSTKLCALHVTFHSDTPLNRHHLQDLVAPLLLLNVDMTVTCSGNLASRTQGIERLLVTRYKEHPPTSILRIYHKLAQEGHKAQAEKRGRLFNIAQCITLGNNLLQVGRTLDYGTDCILAGIVSGLERALRGMGGKPT